jgi:hypothetical protein
MTSAELPPPPAPWARVAGSVTATADHLESFLAALQRGDAKGARRHLDASRHERARGDRLRKEAEAGTDGKVPEELAGAIGRQLARVSIADEVLGSVLPILPDGPAGSERFIDQQIGRVWDLARDAVVLVGPAAARHLQAFRARGYKRVFAVIEPQDRAPVGTGVHKGLPDLERALLALREDPPARYVCLSPGAREAFADKVQASVQFMLQAFALEAVLAWHYAVARITNCVRNLPVLARGIDLGHLERPLKGRAALIVCPGPSLDKSIETIKAHRDRFVIFAVNRAVRNLAVHGLTPDFIAVLDPLPGMYEHVEGFDLSGVQGLIMCGSIATDVPRLPWVQRILSGCFNGAYEQWLDPLIGPQLALASGGTVAHVAAAAAVHLGCSPVAFVGQVLAYQGRRIYAKGTVNEVELGTAEGGMAAEGDIRRKLVHVEGWSGERLASSAQFEAYRSWYERWVPSKPGVRFANCSEGGARIRGMEHLPLSELVESLSGSPMDLGALLGPKGRPRPFLPKDTLRGRIAGRLAVLDPLLKRLAALAVEPTEAGVRELDRARREAMDKLHEVPEATLILDDIVRRFRIRDGDCRTASERLGTLQGHLKEVAQAVELLAAAWHETMTRLQDEA